jgi:catechol 2,3-dioxygenase-like lactoylglutathione lyase family enzyme
VGYKIKEEIMFKSVHTVAVYVSHMECAKMFYTEILGFQVRVDLGPTLCFLQSGDIHVYLEAGHKPSPVDIEDTHLSFFLETEKSAKETFDELKAQGVKILDDAPVEVGNGVYAFQFLDPDGNILEATGH